jgi:hypothetical protein
MYCYSKLSDFFKGHFSDIKLASEVERDLLIKKLANSKSFATTHLVIAQLAKQAEFSPSQVEQLVVIPDANGQVGNIIGDSDVHQFYAVLLETYGDKIQPDVAKQLGLIVREGEYIQVANSDDGPM